MSEFFVADIGNSRIKWGRCTGECVSETVSLPHDDPAAWQRQLEIWQPRPEQRWCVAGVHPQRRDALLAWLRQRFSQVTLLQYAAQLPLRVALERPDTVGIDRLLDAVAANARRDPGRPAVIVDAGSAVTVDWLDDEGVFRGGAIFPGLRLMAQSLNSYTALLPLIAITSATPNMPGASTVAAMEAGIYWTVVGGIEKLVGRLALQANTAPAVFLTGGNAQLLTPGLQSSVIVWPEMTLEGTRLSADGRR